ncbi:alcohol dehydrogenase catalytic domain-containing protein [Mycobacterium branderi]|uniref:Alcohol dehydrogenase n=1 Tax=Mycobacterium branderi TaxID=43348 RepID=A0A7I7WEJ6_9MYCO|nr:alcohol dehydrogenase catalytic domain-containing protein [Mycobacterium branderi]MCV7236350.1 alcohol dehydrogenase catalytic domain-containing protein [Mycobacterium branderi]ORA35513.1 hypothetical protein BST20_18200 [Mycobacterium branderi]BBZ15235.1 alcohol dehydrogenase [Mycobacterium branderi]
MKALIYKGISRVEVETVDDPVLPGDDGAIVRVTMSGICGSDLHQYHVDPGVGSYCMGHEAVGIVVETGANVASFKKGDRVLVSAILSCGRCASCSTGNVQLCQVFGPRIFGQGMHGLGGCQAEFVAVPEADHNMTALPSAISDDVGIMLTDNLATAWYHAKRARVSPGESVAVIGLGPVGQQCVLAAAALGAERIFAIDLLAERRKRAAALGAEPIDDGDAVQGVLGATAGIGVDVVLDANGGPTTVAMALDMMRFGGRVAMIGVPESLTMDFPVFASVLKSLEFHTGATPVQAQLPELLDALETGRLNAKTIESLVTHRMGLTEAQQAFRLFADRKDDVLKVVLDPAR